jgi:hypothetical protein
MENLARTDLLPLGFGWYYILLCVVLIGVGLRFLKKKLWDVEQPRNVLIGMFCLFGLLRSLFFWFVLQFIAKFIFFATPWPLVVLGLIAGFGFEGLLFLYKHEVLIAGDKYGKLISPLRIAFFLLLIFMLGEPVFRRDKTVTVDRHVVVLIDDSDSMHIVDKQWSDAEKMYMGELFGLSKGENWINGGKIKAGFDDFLAISREMGSNGKFLYDTYEKYSDEDLRDFAEVSIDDLTFSIKGLDAIRTELFQFSYIPQVATFCTGLSNINKIYQSKMLSYVRRKPKEFNKNTLKVFLSLNSKMITAYLKYQVQLPDVLDLIAKDMYKNLEPEDKSILMRIVETERYKLRDRILYGVGTDVSVLAKLNETYKTDGYIFGRDAKSIYLDLPEGGQGDNSANHLVADNVFSNRIDVLLFRSETDYASSLERVLKEVSLDSLAGILMLTDGGNNGKSDPLPVCRRLGGLGIPVSSIIIGGTDIPKDIAVVNVAAPDSVYLDDKVRVKAEIKINGLTGEVVKVRLLEGDKVVDEQEVVVPDDDYREELRFSHMPTSHGITHYTIETSVLKGELSAENNSWGFDVAVSDDRTIV